MSSPNSDLERRMSALERRVDDVAADALAGRHLAAALDRDIADLTVKVDANQKAINALGEQTRERLDRLEGKFDRLERKVDEGFAKVDEGFAKVDEEFAKVDAGFTEMRGKFDQLAGGMAAIQRLLEERGE